MPRIRKHPTDKRCSVKGCTRPFRCTGFCGLHYGRHRTHGNPRTVLQLQENHGMSKTLEHGIWRAVKGRCLNPANSSYGIYGGRGIKICKRWANSFSAFYEDMGPRPSSNHSIDRINNNGDYEPGNCRWATISEQANNTRHNKRLEFNGLCLTVTEWTKLLGFSSTVITMRLKRQWSIEETLSVPLGKRRR